MTPGRIDALLRERIGLDPASLGPATVARVVADRVRATGATSADEYARRAAADPAEWDALVGRLVVPESWFFRGGHALFGGLARWAVGRPRPVRVLSAPCSTGEEPYTVAIAFAEAGLTAGGYTVDGVDLSADHLRRAAAGRFPAFSFREPGPDPRPEHFAETPDGWEIAARHRSAVRFRIGNLAAADFLAGEAGYDLIFCRNVLIYLTPEARRRAFEHLDRLLAVGGRLVLTAAEADRLPNGRYERDGRDELCVYRRAERRPTPRARVSEVRRESARKPRLASIELYTPISPPSTAPAGLPPDRRPAAGPNGQPPVDPLAAARELADAGRLAEARAACERALAAGPSADGYALLGAVHLAAGRPDAAAEAFRKALYLDPDHPDARAHAAAGRKGGTA